MACPHDAPLVGSGLPHFVLVGLVAVAAGLFLPRALPEATSAPQADGSSQSSPNNSSTYNPPAWPDPPNYQGMFVRLGLGTAAVLALCVGTLWGCKRRPRVPPSPTSANAQLRLLETLPLGNRCCVHLVHVANRPVLVGADASGIKTIVPLPETFAGTLLETEITDPSASPLTSSTSTDRTLD